MPIEVEDPWAAGGGPRRGAGGETLAVLAGVALLLTAVMQLFFAVVSVLGVLSGILMVSGALDNQRPEPIGWILLVAYGAFFVLCGAPIAVQLPAGIALLRGRRPRALLWAACAACVAPLFTVYCALTALPAGMLVLVLLVLEPPERAA